MTINFMCFLFLLLFLPVNKVFGLDERFFRDTFEGELIRKDYKSQPVEYNWTVESTLKALDINGDSKNEYVSFKKNDGEDWLVIYDSQKKLLFQYKFNKNGLNSKLYKLKLFRLSKNIKLMVLFYFVGTNPYTDSMDVGQLYFITIDNDQGELVASKLNLAQGPAYWKDADKVHVLLSDIDGNGKKELILKMGRVARTYFYKGEGQWKYITMPWGN
jgi:hypothetical protein